MGKESVNDYFMVKRKKNNEERLPGVRAAPRPKGREASTARSVRRYERHPGLLFGLLEVFFSLFCALKLLILSLLWSQRRCTLSLCSRSV